MTSTGHTFAEPVRMSEAYQRLFDDLYHMGWPADIFETVDEAPVSEQVRVSVRPRRKIRRSAR